MKQKNTHLCALIKTMKLPYNTLQSVVVSASSLLIQVPHGVANSERVLHQSCAQISKLCLSFSSLAYCTINLLLKISYKQESTKKQQQIANLTSRTKPFVLLKQFDQFLQCDQQNKNNRFL